MKRHILISTAIFLVCAAILGFMKFSGNKNLEVEDFDIDYTKATDRFSSFGFPSSIDFSLGRIYYNKFSVGFTSVNALVVREDTQTCYLYFDTVDAAEKAFYRLCKEEYVEENTYGRDIKYSFTADGCVVMWDVTSRITICQD